MGSTLLGQRPHLICHATFLIDRLAFAASAPKAAARAAKEQKHLDVAELFAFVCPARMATPTPAGFARSLALDPLPDELETLQLVADELLLRLSNRHYPAPARSGGNCHISGAEQLAVGEAGDGRPPQGQSQA